MNALFEICIKTEIYSCHLINMQQPIITKMRHFHKFPRIASNQDKKKTKKNYVKKRKIRLVAIYPFGSNDIFVECFFAYQNIA